jgi:2-polyprenyl-3-methyl-5-hydroxy-6-metoxy-1,4-benzoquinol methylase
MSTYFHNDRTEMRALLPPAPYSRTLEIGCAAGLFSESLPAQEHWGVEPVAEVAAQARARGLKVFTGFYSDVEKELPDGHFDLIIANDVIEHMPNHELFLRSIRAKLAPGGRFVGSVPNIRSLATLLRLVLAKDWKYTEDGVLDRTHLRFFTARSLRRCLAECGYEVEALAGLRSIFRVDPGISMPKTVLNWMVATFVMILTLGHALDTRFLQYGWRARVR